MLCGNVVFPCLQVKTTLIKCELGIVKNICCKNTSTLVGSHTLPQSLQGSTNVIIIIALSLVRMVSSY